LIKSALKLIHEYFLEKTKKLHFLFVFVYYKLAVKIIVQLAQGNLGS